MRTLVPQGLVRSVHFTYRCWASFWPMIQLRARRSPPTGPEWTPEPPGDCPALTNSSKPIPDLPGDPSAQLYRQAGSGARRSARIAGKFPASPHLKALASVDQFLGVYRPSLPVLFYYSHSVARWKCAWPALANKSRRMRLLLIAFLARMYWYDYAFFARAFAPCFSIRVPACVPQGLDGPNHAPS
jgi:hypothetical protein